MPVPFTAQSGLLQRLQTSESFGLWNRGPRARPEFRGLRGEVRPGALRSVVDLRAYQKRPSGAVLAALRALRPEVLDVQGVLQAERLRVAGRILPHPAGQHYLLSGGRFYHRHGAHGAGKYAGRCLLKALIVYCAEFWLVSRQAREEGAHTQVANRGVVPLEGSGRWQGLAHQQHRLSYGGLRQVHESTFFF